MSNDNHVPLNSPLDVASLIEKMEETFQELLNLSTPVQLRINVVVDGGVSDSLPAMLDEDGPMIQIFYESADDMRTGVGLFTNIYPADDDEPEEFKAVITMTGGGGDTWFRCVTFYGCAIATALAASSIIEEHIESPRELLERIRCRQRHTNWREAYAEVYNRIFKK